MGRWLNRINLRRKLAFMLIAGFLLPMMAYTAITVTSLAQKNREMRLQEMERGLDHTRDQMDGYLSQTIALSLQLVANPTLNELLDATYPSPYEYLVTYQESLQALLEVNPAYPALHDIIVYTDNPTVISGRSVSFLENVDPLLGEKAPEVTLLPVPNQDVTLRISEGGSFLGYDLDVSLLRSMNAIASNRTWNRLLRISFNLSTLEEALRAPAPFESMLLVDGENRILAASPDVIARSPSTRSFDPAALEGKLRPMEISLSRAPALRLIGIYSDTVWSGEYTRILARYLVLALLLTLLGLFLASLAARSITRRLRIIGRHTSEIAQGRFSQLDESEMGSDEVGELVRDIDRMSRQLDAYIQKEYLTELQHTQLQREKATAELHALQSQVNPHFMFNVLEAIRLKAKARGETETARMILYMSRLFRRLLEWHEDLIPLEEELAFIREFLTIQQYRYGSAFSFAVEADPELLGNYIPKMLIQPLVENACVHGMWSGEEDPGAGLFITRKGDYMHVEVTDHGEGMSEERLREVQKLLREGKNEMHSIGLNNVLARCRLYYGEQARMDVCRGEKEGTVFTLDVPLRSRKEDFHVSGADCG